MNFLLVQLVGSAKRGHGDAPAKGETKNYFPIYNNKEYGRLIVRDHKLVA